MKTRNLTIKAILIALTAAGFASLTANAESNASFDARMAAINNFHIQQNLNSQRQLRQQHLQQSLPRLQEGYRQYLASGQRGSFAQYVEWDLMTAAGTNVQGALNAQRARFAGMQQANATIQSGHASYNAGWAANSARTSAVAARYSEQAIRGNAPYVDPRTGATVQLPYYLAAGQTYNHSGYVYAQDPQGNYYQQNGNYWTPVQTGR